MSTAQTTTNYSVQLDVEGQGTVFASFSLPPQMGFDDALALQFAQTLKAFPWPAGNSVNVQVSKSIDTLESFQGHLDTTPPAFT